MTKKHDIIWLESVDSTNNEALRRIQSLDNLSVLATLSQTEGRGQRGNSWLSSPGENLTFSVVLKYNGQSMPAKDQISISAITAISITDLLKEYEISAKIKWPNDIYVEENKICGILIENAIQAGWLAHSIIGIGLNINQKNFDVSIPNPTSIAICKGQNQTLDIVECLDKFMDILKRNLHLLDEDRDYTKIHDIYMSRLRQNSPIEEISLAWQQ